MLRLSHPGQVGKFAAGIFIGTLLQISALLLTDIAGLASTINNFGPMLLHTGDHLFLMVLGSVFLAMGLVSGRLWRHGWQEVSLRLNRR
jgi:hypothetical protein